MSRKPRTVASLAADADTDLDIALVMLWDVGLDVDDPEDVIPARQVSLAQRALGITSAREQLKVDYWLAASGLERDALRQVLAEQGIVLQPNATRIPRNSLRPLRRLYSAPILEQPKPSDESRVAPFEWQVIGEPTNVRLLNLAQVEAIHVALEEDFRNTDDPIFPTGVRDPGLLASAVTRPATGLGDARKYPSIEMGSAALFHSLIHNHPFHNGNKRTALVSLLAMLDENGRVVSCPEQAIFRFTLEAAAHGLVPAHADQLPDREVVAIAAWIRSNSRPIRRGERPMNWRKLKQRLREYDCEFEIPRVGNRLNISRRVPLGRRTILGRQKFETLTTQVACAGDGTEADQNCLHKIRNDLHLDDAHDVDSDTFYGGSTIDSFIIDYRRILRRLGKL